MTSLLDFYQQHQISPVRQDIQDLPAHFGRRAHLYRSLGLPPFAIRGKSVLEVGPGSGENALYTASLNPARYVFVEPNPTAAAELRERWPMTHSGDERWEIVDVSVEAYAGGTFDLVLCEGLLGLCGSDPKVLLEYVVKHVAVGGVLVITCIDPISDHAEVLRRCIAQRIIDRYRSAPLAEQVAQLCAVFAPHLATLKGMTRSVEDWILDNLLNPASIGPTFSIPDACEALDGRFEVLGCSPRFLLDWRWYKDSAPGNAWAVQSYWRQAHNLLDCRRTFPQRSERSNRELSAKCLEVRQALRVFEAGGPPPREALTFTDISWFGRGQQYLSFVRV